MAPFVRLVRRYKRRTPTHNTLHVSGIADRRRSAYIPRIRRIRGCPSPTTVRSLVFFFFFSSLYFLLFFAPRAYYAYYVYGRMCVSESNHGEQRAENRDPVNRP